MKKFDDDHDDEMKFSWLGLFSVTSLCSFMFSLFLYLIDGDNISLFLSFGGIALVFAFISYLNESRKKSSGIF